MEVSGGRKTRHNAMNHDSALSTPQNGKREFFNLLEILQSDKHWVSSGEPNPLSLEFVKKFCAGFPGHTKSEFRHQFLEAIKTEYDGGEFFDVPVCITNVIWKFREEIVNANY